MSVDGDYLRAALEATLAGGFKDLLMKNSNFKSSFSKIYRLPCKFILTKSHRPADEKTPEEAKSVVPLLASLATVKSLN